VLGQKIHHLLAVGAAQSCPLPYVMCVSLTSKLVTKVFSQHEGFEAIDSAFEDIRRHV
jgi:hypothetical protein